MNHFIDIYKCPKNVPAEIFYPDGTILVRTDDEILFNYIRAEIKESQTPGFYIEYKGKTIKLDRNGTPEEYPDDEFFGANLTQLLRLV